MKAEHDETPSESAAAQIEQKLKDLSKEITDPRLSGTITDIIEAFESKKTLIGDIAFRDEGTGLYNYFFFERRLKEEVSRALRYQRSLSILMIELGEGFFDNFRDTALTIAETLRQSDTCAVMRGNIISVLLPETASAQAGRVADKILNNIQPFCLSTAVDGWIGIAGLTGLRNTPEKLEAAGDGAREQAKTDRIPVFTAED